MDTHAAASGLPGSYRWRALGASVQGALHRRRQQPNQDALAWWPKETPATAMVLAVADGHGSPRSSRSADGARLAVQTALEVFQLFLMEPDTVGQADLHDFCQDWLQTALVEQWRQAVRDDLERNPLPAAETASQKKGHGPFLAYGTTLLVVAVFPGAMLFVQLGDGDILAVADDGSVARPLPPDARLFANETTSLCSAGAVADFRVRVLPLPVGAPALVLLSTDGYANSFRDDAGFLQVGGDLLGLLRSEGVEAVAANLESWLNEASEHGSGDDVTVALLYRIDEEAGEP